MEVFVVQVMYKVTKKMLVVDPIRSKDSLKQFKSGVKEVDVYARREHSLSTEDNADSRVFCLYEDNIPNLGALGYFSIGLKEVCGREKDALFSNNLKCTNQVLYLEYFAIDRRHKNNGLANWLMVDALTKALTVFQIVGGLNFIALNAVDKAAAEYFRSDWEFEEILRATHPFMICRGDTIRNKLARLKLLNTA